MGCGIVIWKNSGHCTNGTGQAGSRKMYIFRDGLCGLHSIGLKPTEGRLSYHTITKENLKFSKSLSWNVPREWLDERNAGTIREICRLMEI